MVRRCNWGTCNADYRYPERIAGYRFIPFPNPRTKLEKCLRWIKACNRSEKQLSVDNMNKNRVICSRHFVGSRGPSELYPDPVPADGSAPTPSCSVRICDTNLMKDDSESDIHNNELIQRLMLLDQVVVPPAKFGDYNSLAPVTFSTIGPTATCLLKNKYLEKWNEEYLSQIQTSKLFPSRTSTATGSDTPCDHCGSVRSETTANIPAPAILHHSDVARCQPAEASCNLAVATQKLTGAPKPSFVALSHPISSPSIPPPTQTCVSLGQSFAVGHSIQPLFVSQTEIVECKPIVGLSQSNMYQGHQTDVGSNLGTAECKPSDALSQYVANQNIPTVAANQLVSHYEASQNVPTVASSQMISQYEASQNITTVPASHMIRQYEANQNIHTVAASQMVSQYEANQNIPTVAAIQMEVTETRPISVRIQPAISQSNPAYTVSQPVVSAPNLPDATTHLAVFPALNIKTEDLNNSSNGLSDTGAPSTFLSSPSSSSSSTTQTGTCAGQFKIIRNGNGPSVTDYKPVSKQPCRFSSTSVKEGIQAPNKRVKVTHSRTRTPTRIYTTYTANQHAPFKHPSAQYLPLVTSQPIHQTSAVDTCLTSTDSAMLKASQLAPLIHTKAKASPSTTSKSIDQTSHVDTRLTANTSSNVPATVKEIDEAPYVSAKRASSPLKASQQAPYINTNSGFSPPTTSETTKHRSCSDIELASTRSTNVDEQAPAQFKRQNPYEQIKPNPSFAANAMQQSSDPVAVFLPSTSVGSIKPVSCKVSMPTSSILSTAVDPKKTEMPTDTPKFQSRSHGRRVRCCPDFELLTKYLELKRHTFLDTYGSSEKLTNIYKQYIKVTKLFCDTVVNEINNAEIKATSTALKNTQTSETVHILQNSNTFPPPVIAQANGARLVHEQTIVLKNVVPACLRNPEADASHTGAIPTTVGDTEREEGPADEVYVKHSRAAIEIKQEQLDGEYEKLKDSDHQALEHSDSTLEAMKQAATYFSACGAVGQSGAYPFVGKIKQEPLEPELEAAKHSTGSDDNDTKRQAAMEVIRQTSECSKSIEKADELTQEAYDATCDHIEHHIQSLETMRSAAMDSIGFEAVERDGQSDVRPELVELGLDANSQKQPEMDYHYVFEPLGYSEQNVSAERLKLKVNECANEAMEYSNLDTVEPEPMDTINTSIEHTEQGVVVGKVKLEAVDDVDAEHVKRSELYVIETIGHSEQVECLKTIKLEVEDSSGERIEQSKQVGKMKKARRS